MNVYGGGCMHVGGHGVLVEVRAQGPASSFIAVHFICYCCLIYLSCYYVHYSVKVLDPLGLEL